MPGAQRAKVIFIIHLQLLIDICTHMVLLECLLFLCIRFLLQPVWCVFVCGVCACVGGDIRVSVCVWVGVVCKQCAFTTSKSCTDSNKDMK